MKLKNTILVGLSVLVVSVGVILYMVPQLILMGGIYWSNYVAPTEYSLEVKKKVVAIKDNFLKEVEAEGYTNPYDPEILIGSTPALVFFAGDENSGTIVAPAWEDTPQMMQDLMNEWAAKTDSKYSGRDFFEKNFNWFLIPHELGHFLDATQGTTSNAPENLYDGELYANKVAIAFWLKQGMEKELQEFITEMDKYWKVLDRPAPEGVDEKVYFNENYNTLGNNPYHYGYYQLLLYRQAWAQRDTLTSVVVKK